MTTPGQQFTADLESMVIATKERMEALSRQSIQATCEQVVQNSPVLTGFFRGNWQPSIGAPPQNLGPQTPSENTADADKLADKGSAQLSLLIAQFKLGQIFFLVNNTAYGPRLENGFTGRDSLGREIHQRGRFFVRNALARWGDTVRRAAIDLKMTLR
jgi:hypothetical protein